MINLRCMFCDINYIQDFKHLLEHQLGEGCIDWQIHLATMKYDKFDKTFAWLHHYEFEFNESPHLMVNKTMNTLKEYGYKWQ